MAYNAAREFIQNLRALPSRFVESLVRHGRPTSVRAQTPAVAQNFFLHMHSARIHKHSLKTFTTMGLGIMTTAMFVILCVTGVLLMVYYKPSVAGAYDSIKDIHFVVPTPHRPKHAPMGSPWHGHPGHTAHGARVLYGGIQATA